MSSNGEFGIRGRYIHAFRGVSDEADDEAGGAFLDISSLVMASVSFSSAILAMACEIFL